MGDETGMCACGRPLHYRDAKMRDMVMRVCENLGDYILVRAGDHAYKVQRHYVALHGIEESEMNKLNFEQIA